MLETPKFSIHDFDGILIKEEFVDKIFELSKKTAPFEDWGVIVGKPLGELTRQDLRDEAHPTQIKVAGEYPKKFVNFAWITAVSEMPKKELGIKSRILLEPTKKHYYAENAGIDIFNDKAYDTLNDTQAELNKRRRGEKILAIYHTHVYDWATLQIKNKIVTIDDICSLSEADIAEARDRKRFFWPPYLGGKPQKEGSHPTLGLGLGVFGIVYNGNFFIEHSGKPKLTPIDFSKYKPVGLSMHKVVPTWGLMNLTPSVEKVKLLCHPKG